MKLMLITEFKTCNFSINDWKALNCFFASYELISKDEKTINGYLSRAKGLIYKV